MEENPQLMATKSMIRSVLISEKDGVQASHFLADYLLITGEKIPFKDFGFTNVEDFIRSIPDVVYIQQRPGCEPTYFAVADESTAHIQKLVSRQKSSKKSKPVQRGPTRYPKAHHSVMAKKWYSSGKIMPSNFHYSGHIVAPFGFRTSSYRQNNYDHKPEPKSPEYRPFSSSKTSPLLITIKNTTGFQERLIERCISDSGGGKKIISRALKGIVGQRSEERKFNKGYEPPPRFQRLLAGGAQESNAAESSGTPSHNISTDKSFSDHTGVNQRPQGETGFGPPISEASSEGVKSWVAKLLKNYTNGLWFSRFVVMYKEVFDEEAPSNLIDLLKKWTDVAVVELNDVANREVLYPAKDRSQVLSPPKVIQNKRNVSFVPAKKAKPVWQDFIVPDAELLPIDKECFVYVAYCENLGHFYVQEEFSCVDRITEKLGEACKNQAVPDASVLQSGVFCAALYSGDGRWYRARVLYMASDTEVHVIFIDYGNAETVLISNIRCLTRDVASIPAQAIQCLLFGLKPLTESGWSDEAILFFKEFVAEEKIEIFTYSYKEGRCIVEIYSEKYGDHSLNQLLFEKNLVGTDLQISDSDTLQEMEENEPCRLEVPDEDYLEVVVAYVDLQSCFIRLIGEDFSEKLEAFEDKLETLYKATKGYAGQLNPGSVCIACAEMHYHRVKIIEIKKEQAHCLFVDHGYLEWISIEKLRPLDPDINKKLSYQAIPCLLAGLEGFMKLPTTMTELIERSRNKICMAEAVSRDPLSVMLYDTHGDEDININLKIAEKLKSEGANVNMEVFSDGTDSQTLEKSGASSPNHPDVESPEQLDVVSLASLAFKEKLLPSESNIVMGSSAHPSFESDSSECQPLYTWVKKEGQWTSQSKLNSKAVSGEQAVMENQQSEVVLPPSTVSDTKTVISPPTNVDSQILTVPLEAKTETAAASATPLKYNDVLCTDYHSWSLPGLAPLPEVGQFFDVFVTSISNPSNFVVLPLNLLSQLEKLMHTMNAHFQTLKDDSTSKSFEPVCVPEPKLGHLYMAFVKGTYYRVIYKEIIDGQLHVFLVDYCEHSMVSPDALFFLPKQFWSLPFTACRAKLYGVKPIGSHWLESANLKLCNLALKKPIVALLKSIEGPPDIGPDGDHSNANVVAERCLLLQLIETSDPDKDIIVSEALIEMGLADYVNR